MEHVQASQVVVETCFDLSEHHVARLEHGVKDFRLCRLDLLQHLLYALNGSQHIVSHGVGNHLNRLVLGTKSQVLFKLADVLKLEKSAFFALEVEILHFEFSVDYLVFSDLDFTPVPIQFLWAFQQQFLDFALLLLWLTTRLVVSVCEVGTLNRALLNILSGTECLPGCLVAKTNLRLAFFWRRNNHDGVLLAA